MGWYVHIHVAFACDENEGVAALAKKHRPAIQDGDDGWRAAQWFLDDLSERTGRNRGPKGGLSLWGMVGNYTRVDSFCEILKPFWGELLTGEVDGGPCSHEHVIVFEEQEQRESATAYQIARDEESGEVSVAKYAELPFSWQQF